MHSTSLLKPVLKSQEFPASSSAFGDCNYSNQKWSNKSSAASTSVDAPSVSNRAASSSGLGAPPLPNKNISPVKACLCAPTNHPGSFRCKFHRAKSASRVSSVASAIINQASNLSITSTSTTNKLTNNLTSNLTSKTFLAATIVSRRAIAGVRPPSPLPPSSSAIPLDRVAASRMAGSRVVGASRLSKVTTAAADQYGHAEKAEESPFRFLKQAVASGASVLKKGMNDDGAISGATGGGDRFYEVRPKDTLSAIARNFGTEVEVLLEANSLKSDVLQPGQKIWIPKTYNIQKGDTLSKIAKEHSTTVGDILKINSIDNPDQILPGDILLLP